MSKKSASKLFQTEEPTKFEEDSMNLPEEATTEEEMSEETPEEDSEPEVKEEPKETVEEKHEEVKTEVPVNTEYNPTDIVDVELTAIKKQRFRFNGDNSKILELNTRDLGISNRLGIAYNNLNTLMEEVAQTLSGVPGIDEDNDDDIELTDELNDTVVSALKRLDASMRKEIDFLFDAPVSEILGDGGSMYDPLGGVFRYEHIIEKLAQLYETDLDKEFFILKQRVSDRTSKYTRMKKATKKYHR